MDAAGLIVSGLETIADHVPSDRLHELERRLVGKAVHLAAHEVRRGELKNFTGIDSAYEPPEQPELHLHTAQTSVADGAARIAALLA